MYLKTLITVMETKACRLRSAAFSLNVIHRGAATLQHAIRREGEEWQEYFPNHFIYAFFAFNTLYNVDWEESFKEGRIISVRKRRITTENGYVSYVEETEKNKYNKYLSFCFQNEQFVNLYKLFFIRFVLQDNSKEGVNESLSSIQIDRLPHGSIKKREYVQKFKDAVFDLFSDGSFGQRNITQIVGFIYSIRCNIFHGIKSIEDMKDYGQQVRLDFYASILVALNQMVFSYLDYLIQGDSFADNFDKLYSDLSSKMSNSPLTKG